MEKFESKIIRQIEILGRVLFRQNIVTIEDLSEIYKCNAITIKRDLQNLRSLGIRIHSSGKKGINILGSIPKEIVFNLVQLYFSSKILKSTYDKATYFLVDKKHEFSLRIVTLLYKAIDENRIALITYEKNKVKKNYFIEPYLIYQSEKTWRVLASLNGSVKQFLLYRISRIELTEEKFEKPDNYAISELLKYSFLSWTGKQQYNVKLKVTKPWSKWLVSRPLAVHQKAYRKNSDTLIIEITVNSLDEIARWIAGRGRGIYVLEPEILKEKVITIAEEIIKTYKNY